MMPPNPLIVAFLGQERRDALLREAEDRRLVRKARVTRKESRLLHYVARVPMAWRTLTVGPRPSHEPEPEPIEKEAGDDSPAAA
jgi:hypothetical protein